VKLHTSTAQLVVALLPKPQCASSTSPPPDLATKCRQSQPPCTARGAAEATRSPAFAPPPRQGDHRVAFDTRKGGEWGGAAIPGHPGRPPRSTTPSRKLHYVTVMPPHAAARSGGGGEQPRPLRPPRLPTTSTVLHPAQQPPANPRAPSNQPPCATGVATRRRPLTERESTETTWSSPLSSAATQRRAPTPPFTAMREGGGGSPAAILLASPLGGARGPTLAAARRKEGARSRV
jgi:hypothetical protein